MKQVSKNEMEKEREGGKNPHKTSYSLALIWNTWDLGWYQVRMSAKKQEGL